MSVIFCIVASVLWICSELTTANFTFTYQMALRCKEHICQHGYKYETYYRVDSSDHKHLKTDSEVDFEMHIAILAASDGHVLLSTVPQPTSTDPVYEIVIGGGDNKFTQLRRSMRNNAKASSKTPNILSPIEFRAFYIIITTDGTIEIGKEGEPLAFLIYQDVDPLPIKYFSFSAWSGVEAKFLYDCPPPQLNKTDVPTSPNSEMVDEKLSNTESLKRTMLMGRMPQVPPAEKMGVKLGVKITSIFYDAFTMKLTTGLSVFMSWMDNSMAWNPNKFNGTTRVTFRQGQIWRPTFFVYNSDAIGTLDTKNPDLIWMSYGGDAIFHFQTTINTWCFNDTSVLNRWPRDEYRCSVIIQPWETHEQIFLHIPKISDMEGFTDIDEVIHNEWEVDYEQHVLSAMSWNQIHPNTSAIQSDRLVIEMDLKRRATSYNIVFYTPLLVLVTFVLTSFWTEPLTMARVWFYAGCTVVICMGLCYIDFLIPCHTIPSILVLYSAVLIGILVALMIQVLLMTSMAKKLCQKQAVDDFLIQRWVRLLFCLHEIKICNMYETLEERNQTAEFDGDFGTCSTTRLTNIKEVQSDSKDCDNRRLVAEILDKTMFFVFSIVFASMLILHF